LNNQRRVYTAPARSKILVLRRNAGNYKKQQTVANAVNATEDGFYFLSA
jgi:hypothetical protein